MIKTEFGIIEEIEETHKPTDRCIYANQRI